MVERHIHPSGEVTVILGGKYVELHDAYLSVAEALTHGGIFHNTKVNIRWLTTEEVNHENVAEVFEGADALLIPEASGAAGSRAKLR